MRDKMLVKIANFFLRRGSKELNVTIEGLIKYGMNSIARDELEGRKPPKHYTEYLQKREEND